ncbi:MAG: DUF5069 domain-containing protein [Cyanobacteria bacterium REEB65]|nr:DUF5069 domain-containing protein [Cyanobacteria bacterium REEB65]
MDLTKQVPRSPFAELGGVAWLPRAIDKGRAHLAGTNGEYNFDCPMDKILFEHLGIDAPAFLVALRSNGSDEAMLDWVKHHAEHFDEQAIQESNDHIRHHGPSAERREYFDNYVKKVAPGRTDIQSWAEIIAIEEGHPLPAGAR